MQNFYDDFSEKPKRPSYFWKGVIVGGVIIGLLLAAVFSCLYISITRSQEKNDDSQLNPLPWEEKRDNGDESKDIEIIPEIGQYFLAVVNAVDRATPAVVGISNFGIVSDFWGQSRLQERAAGSGVIIREDGYIVTNYHVIENARELIVTLGSGEELPAAIIGADPPTDLAVIKVDKRGIPTAEFANSDTIRVGEPAIAIGNPLGLDFQQSVTLGVVSARERSITIQGQKFNFIQTDAAINDGNSGGALVNIHGKVIGINTAKIKIPGVEGMGFAIPSNTVMQIASDLVDKGRVIRPWMGVSPRTLTRLDAERMGLDVDYGVLVTEVVAGSPAERAGMQPMDVIVSIGGNKIADVSELQHEIYQFNIGDTIQVGIFREREKIVIEVTLEKLP
ncbi:MAG: trypsin-like peptidase domain-containing protein [Bacillota bacterium]|nr:trypsin-like peptidase domain-containing protein [Bacillota bacterium]